MVNKTAEFWGRVHHNYIKIHNWLTGFLPSTQFKDDASGEGKLLKMVYADHRLYAGHRLCTLVTDSVN